MALGEPDAAEPAATNALPVLCANVEALGDAVARKLESLSEKAEESEREKTALTATIDRERKATLIANDTIAELENQIYALNESLAAEIGRAHV